MPFASLADYLERLDGSNRLLRIGNEVAADLELATIANHASPERALFFERVTGHAWPVVAHLLGSEDRIRAALEVDSLAEIADRVANWLASPAQVGWLERIKGTAASPDRFAPKAARHGACQQIVKLGRDVRLGELPAPRSWPDELHRSLTGLVLTPGDEGTAANTECLAVELLADDRLAIDWSLHDSTARSFAAAAAAGVRMPVAIALGGDPLYAFLGARVPVQLDRWQFVGLLRGRPVELVKCRTHALEVPADADVIIEGFIDPTQEPVAGGPLATATGYYLPAGPRHEITVTALTHRTNPILPVVIHGGACREAMAVERALGKMLRPLLERAVPELVDFHVPDVGAWQQFVFIALRKRYPQQARKVAAAIWGLDWAMFTKYLVLVDEHVDIHDPMAVLQAIGSEADPARDVLFHSGPTSPADHAQHSLLAGSHLAIDATRKLPGEHPRAWPQPLVPDAETERRVLERWADFGLPQPSDAQLDASAAPR